MASFFDRLLGSRTPPAEAKPKSVARVNAYQAVGIMPCAKACDPARAIQKQRFLARRAPVLPLAICDRKGQCTCRFRKYEDRRVESQRNPYNSELVKSYPGADKRRSKGRRSSDF